MVWITTVPEHEATGTLANAYQRQAATLGHPSEFSLLGSLDPDLVAARLDLYRASERCSSMLTQRQRLLVAYVASVLNRTPHCASQVPHKLTVDPGAMTHADVQALREVGLDDLAIVDANNMCAHLNYVNRVAAGLGLHHEVAADFPAFATIPDGAT